MGLPEISDIHVSLNLGTSGAPLIQAEIQYMGLFVFLGRTTPYGVVLMEKGYLSMFT